MRFDWVSKKKLSQRTLKQKKTKKKRKVTKGTSNKRNNWNEPSQGKCVMSQQQQQQQHQACNDFPTIPQWRKF